MGEEPFCVAGRVCDEGDEVVCMIDYVLVSPCDGEPAGDVLHAGRIVGAVEACRSLDGPFCRMVGKDQQQRNLWMSCFCGNDSLSSQLVEITVMAYQKLCDSEIYDVLLYGCYQ